MTSSRLFTILSRNINTDPPVPALQELYLDVSCAFVQLVQNMSLGRPSPFNFVEADELENVPHAVTIGCPEPHDGGYPCPLVSMLLTSP